MKRTDPTSSTRKRTSVRALIATALVLSMLPMFATFAPGGQVAGFTTALSASADQIWYQSVGRANADAPCQESSADDLTAGWTQWTPSWEQWANNGNGGFVCNRQITWDFTTSSGSTGRTSPFGEIGPGGGLIFLRSGGKTYEMAPKDWSVNEGGIEWCDVSTTVSTSGGVGTGAANTTAMLAVCAVGAANAVRAYNGGGFTDWYLPSELELNAMCNFSRNPTAPAAPTVPCNGGNPMGGPPQNADFENGEFGFARRHYWSSTQVSSDATKALAQAYGNGNWTEYTKLSPNTHGVRPIRSY